MPITIYARNARDLLPGDVLMNGERVLHVLSGARVSVTTTGRDYALPGDRKVALSSCAPCRGVLVIESAHV